MKRTMTNLFAVLMASAAVAGTGKDSLTDNFIQITFVPPMSTHGIETTNLNNQISINILAGYSGGLNGVEVGTFANAIRYDMYGAQISGWGNFVGGNSEGGQFAGFINVNRKDLRGGQFSGFANVGLGNLEGVQGSGFGNFAKDTVTGGQFAGFANVALSDVTGTQGSGYANVAVGNTFGGQFSGFANIQVGNIKGVQGTGFVNVATDSVEGAQIAGFINYANYVKGLQLGFINVADTIDGVPIGFLSFARNGYNKFEISGSEALYAQAAVRLGVRRFYNVFTIGAKPMSKDIAWGYGYGLGTAFEVNEKMDLEVEAHTFHILNQLEWDYDINSLNMIKFNANHQLGERLDVFAGISWNVMVSQTRNDEGNLTGALIAPYKVYDIQKRNSTITMWPGMSAGIRF